MKNTVLALIATFSAVAFLSTPAFAAGGSKATLQAPANDGIQGNAKAGKAKSAACAACHGKDGNSAAPNFPKLAGQGEKYLIKQMNDIKSGERPIAEMTGQLDSYSAQDIADVAAFYNSKTASNGQTSKELAKLGASIYRGGIPDRKVPSCAACHGPAGKGMPGAAFPALAGQHAAYTAAQLKAFRTAADALASDKTSGRRNDGDGMMMRTTAHRMTDGQIDAVASFIQGLH